MARPQVYSQGPLKLRDAEHVGPRLPREYPIESSVCDPSSERHATGTLKTYGSAQPQVEEPG